MSEEKPSQEPAPLREPDSMPKRSRWLAWLGATAVALAGLAAIYGQYGPAGNANPAASGAHAAMLSALKDLNTGEMAAFVPKPTPVTPKPFTFSDGAGKPRTLADWQGKIVLLNLWATWCVPCRVEMPALDALQKELGGADFEVVALNTDFGDLAKAKAFYDEIKITSLALYQDPGARNLSALSVLGLPTTILIGRDGTEIGRLVGPAEWGSEDAKRLVKAVVAAK